VSHNMAVKDATGVTRRVVSMDTDLGGTGDEIHLQHVGVCTASYRILGYELLSVTTSTAVALGASLGIPTGTRSALITVETADIRFRQDGSNPTAVPSTNANAGPLVSAGTAFEVAPMDSSGAPALGAVRLRAVSSTATVIVEYRAPRVAD
jgi:hypothetical protein